MRPQLLYGFVKIGIGPYRGERMNSAVQSEFVVKVQPNSRRWRQGCCECQRSFSYNPSLFVRMAPPSPANTDLPTVKDTTEASARELAGRPSRYAPRLCAASEMNHKPCSFATRRSSAWSAGLPKISADKIAFVFLLMLLSTLAGSRVSVSGSISAKRGLLSSWSHRHGRPVGKRRRDKFGAFEIQGHSDGE